LQISRKFARWFAQMGFKQQEIGQAANVVIPGPTSRMAAVVDKPLIALILNVITI
jgi:hypothetical protein